MIVPLRSAQQMKFNKAGSVAQVAIPRRPYALENSSREPGMTLKRFIAINMANPPDPQPAPMRLEFQIDALPVAGSPALRSTSEGRRDRNTMNEIPTTSSSIPRPGFSRICASPRRSTRPRRANGRRRCGTRSKNPACPPTWVPDDLGGAGAEMPDGFAVLRVAGRFAAPVPLAETLIAGWLLARAGSRCRPGR